jgi:hypothetical protein
MLVDTRRFRAVGHQLDATCTAPPTVATAEVERAVARAPAPCASSTSGSGVDEGLRPCARVFRLRLEALRGNSRGRFSGSNEGL